MPAMDYERIAELYDAFVTADFDIDFFRTEALAADGPVLELMAGTGRVSIPLIDAGVELTCLDSSPGMLRILRDKLALRALRATVVEADAGGFALDRRFAAVLIPFHSFAELLAERERAGCLACIRQHLAPGGRAIVTLHNPRQRLRDEDGAWHLVAEFAHPETGTVIVHRRGRPDSEAHLVVGEQRYRHLAADDTLIEELTLPVRFCPVGHAEFEALATSQDLVVEDRYGDYRRGPLTEDSPVMIFVLRHAGTGAVG